MSSNKSILQFPNEKQFVVTFPKGLVLAKGWKKGDTLEFSIDTKGEINIKKCQKM
jgi:bifunctional DNA-binding transcriptional regulator/antitoxin component of YhaV-PrlF toxin-antitoxin module